MYSVGLAYLLWLVSGCGALGFHRFYLGKIPTGLLWMFTGGLGMVGSVYDFFTLGRQVREANYRDAILQDRAERNQRAYSINDLNDDLNDLVNGRSVGKTRTVRDGVTNIVNTPKDSVERIILKLAKQNNGIIAIADVALEANISIDEAKNDLETLVNKGFVEMRVKKTGAIVYVIREYLTDESSLETF
jgi:TM2 domain-containing membrane protein YozV/predicted transcriptional regulator